MKWSELKSFLQVAQSGSRGLGSISGLRIKMIDPMLPAPILDLSGDGRFELWKTNRLIEVTLPDGRPLDPEKTYTLATLDFVAMGGDDLQWPISQISPERIKIWDDKLARTAIVNYVEHLQVVNSEDSPLIDVARPRLQFVNPKEELKQSGKKKLKKIRNALKRRKK